MGSAVLFSMVGISAAILFLWFCNKMRVRGHQSRMESSAKFDPLAQDESTRLRS